MLKLYLLLYAHDIVIFVIMKICYKKVWKLYMIIVPVGN